MPRRQSLFIAAVAAAGLTTLGFPTSTAEAAPITSSISAVADAGDRRIQFLTYERDTRFGQFDTPVANWTDSDWWRTPGV